MFDLLSGTSTQVGIHDGPIKCVRWFEMPQGGILVTGSWDKTLKVRVYSCTPPNSIRSGFSLLVLLFSQHMVTDTGKHVPPNQVLGPPIARPVGYCGSQGTLLCHGRKESGARGRDRGPTNPDIRLDEPSDALQSLCSFPSRSRAVFNTWLIAVFSLCLFR